MKNRGVKRYAHFDRRISLDQVWTYVTNPNRVAAHGFYPFIHYRQTIQKYSRQSGPREKHRELCYSAHIDRCIYQYYGFLLNQLYDKRVERDGLSDSAVAYRSGLGKNNIHLAKQAFDFIRNHAPCYIIVADFTNFFDTLDHKYLKEQLCGLFDQGALPADYYAVFKNITRYSTWDLRDLLALNGLDDTRRGRETLNNRAQVLTLSEFKLHKSKYIVPHKELFGIPQGSAISAVLSNIYMLEFDKQLWQYVGSQGGLYMRYSDDFIVVLPKGTESGFLSQLTFVQQAVTDIPNLHLQPEKTQIFDHHDNQVVNCNAEYFAGVQPGKNLLNYLGFTFDGKVITIRDKTLSKYYYRMYRKVKTIVKSQGYTPEGKRITCENLYLKYSRKGARKGRGNFLTYVQRAQAIFGPNEAIDRGTKLHMQKIRRRLDQMKG